MKINLRQRKGKKAISLVIEYYNGSKKVDGKIKHFRQFETLPYKLHINPKTKHERAENKKNLQAAEMVLAQKKLEYANRQYGIPTEKGDKIYLLDYFHELTKKRLESMGNYGNWDAAYKHLSNFLEHNPTLAEVDTKLVEEFKEYLLKAPISRGGRKLSRNSAVSYFNKLRACLNQAFDDGLISENPVRRVKSIKAEDTKREFLTLDELKKVAKAECKNQILKEAFLFSCYTGMRFKDIQNLKWRDVSKTKDEMYRVTFRQQKTKGQEYLDIPTHAIDNYTKGKGNTDEKVFRGLKYSAWHNIELKKWIMKAGITKDITFHCARHTFATLQFKFGTDIYTVSKLLGHKDLKTTQIYAKVMDRKKRDAVNRIPDVLG